VTFAQSNDALAAYEALDKRSFQGRLLHLLPAVDKHPKPEGEGAKTLKAKRSEDRKAQAGREFNWAMLYMNVRSLFTFGCSSR
jgi:multiple RNA-binding domain-containing protein 1